MALHPKVTVAACVLVVAAGLIFLLSPRQTADLPPVPKAELVLEAGYFTQIDAGTPLAISLYPRHFEPIVERFAAFIDKLVQTQLWKELTKGRLGAKLQENPEIQKQLADSSLPAFDQLSGEVIRDLFENTLGSLEEVFFAIGPHLSEGVEGLVLPELLLGLRFQKELKDSSKLVAKLTQSVEPLLCTQNTTQPSELLTVDTSPKETKIAFSSRKLEGFSSERPLSKSGKFLRLQSAQLKDAAALAWFNYDGMRALVQSLGSSVSPAAIERIKKDCKDQAFSKHLDDLGPMFEGAQAAMEQSFPRGAEALFSTIAVSSNFHTRICQAIAPDSSHFGFLSSLKRADSTVSLQHTVSDKTVLSFTLDGSYILQQIEILKHTYDEEVLKEVRMDQDLEAVLQNLEALEKLIHRYDLSQIAFALNLQGLMSLPSAGLILEHRKGSSASLLEDLSIRAGAFFQPSPFEFDSELSVLRVNILPQLQVTGQVLDSGRIIFSSTPPLKDRLEKLLAEPTQETYLHRFRVGEEPIDEILQGTDYTVYFSSAPVLEYFKGLIPLFGQQLSGVDAGALFSEVESLFSYRELSYQRSALYREGVQCSDTVSEYVQ